MLHLAPSVKYYLYSPAADMRKSFDGLCGLVTNYMGLPPLSGAVFIFLNKRRTQVKLLCFENDGFALWHKRLEQGTFELPAPAATANGVHVSLSNQQLQLILSGITLSSVHRRKRYQQTAL